MTTRSAAARNNNSETPAPTPPPPPPPPPPPADSTNPAPGKRKPDREPEPDPTTQRKTRKVDNKTAETIASKTVPKLKIQLSASKLGAVVKNNQSEPDHARGQENDDPSQTELTHEQYRRMRKIQKALARARRDPRAAFACIQSLDEGTPSVRAEILAWLDEQIPTDLKREGD